ncbi:unnamed protein product [Calicophoron daubneyi]|uniref:Maturase K n=1 Tax=Calicophoron daubneyi TaxID=300641 RepID=A0AAV2TJB5_CALDB
MEYQYQYLNLYAKQSIDEDSERDSKSGTHHGQNYVILLSSDCMIWWNMPNFSMYCLQQPLALRIKKKLMISREYASKVYLSKSINAIDRRCFGFFFVDYVPANFLILSNYQSFEVYIRNIFVSWSTLVFLYFHSLRNHNEF